MLNLRREKNYLNIVVVITIVNHKHITAEHTHLYCPVNISKLVLKQSKGPGSIVRTCKTEKCNWFTSHKTIWEVSILLKCWDVEHICFNECTYHFVHFENFLQVPKFDIPSWWHAFCGCRCETDACLCEALLAVSVRQTAQNWPHTWRRA
jgi:hypothetical protein